LLKAFVNRVNLRICILMVRFWRSTWDVQTRGRIGTADDWDNLRRNHFRRRVAALAFPACPVDLDELREVHAVAQRRFNRERIGREASALNWNGCDAVA